MAQIDLKQIRNLGIIAHIDAGKTSTSEGLLFYSGLTHRYGNIDDGTTVLDYLPEERERGITIVAAAATLPWKQHFIHLIDTPGHIDFTAEVERSLRVIDGAVVVFSGVEGVEAQSEKVWRQADRYNVSKIAFINKLDRLGAVFSRVFTEINHKFGNCALPLQIPIGVEDDFSGVIDLVSMQELRFDGDDNELVTATPIAPEHHAEAQLWRERLLERLADECDQIATFYLEGENIDPELLQQRIRALTLSNHIVPVLAGSAKRRIGLQPLLDAMLMYLPCPADRPEIAALRAKDELPITIHADADAPFTGFIFKVIASNSADLLYMRTYSGTLSRDSMLFNPRTGEKVKLKQLLRLYAKNTQAVDEVGPGDIVGVIGPRNCGTGDTLCLMHKPVVLEKITFPEPVISMAVEPRYSRDKDKLDAALQLLCREDPTLAVSQDEETGQRLLAGMGELHLEVNLRRLLSEFHLEVKVGEPRVAYRETFRTATESSIIFSKTFADDELYAEATVAFQPLARGAEAFNITNTLNKGDKQFRNYIATAEQALIDGLRTGGNHGYPLIYVAAELRRLIVHPEKTTDGAVVGAILQSINTALNEVGTTVLEPVMHLEIFAPPATVGEINMYLQPRRAIIQQMTDVNDLKRIECEVPLAEMFGFGKALPKLSGGRASFSMQPCGYQELPT